MAYSSQGNHTGQLDFCNWLADGIRELKSSDRRCSLGYFIFSNAVGLNSILDWVDFLLCFPQL